MCFFLCRHHLVLSSTCTTLLTYTYLHSDDASSHVVTLLHLSRVCRVVKGGCDVGCCYSPGCPLYGRVEQRPWSHRRVSSPLRADHRVLSVRLFSLPTVLPTIPAVLPTIPSVLPHPTIPTLLPPLPSVLPTVPSILPSLHSPLPHPQSSPTHSPNTHPPPPGLALACGSD